MILLFVALLLLRAEATSQNTLYITAGAPNGTLLKAFQNPAITSIYLKADYNIGDEFAAYAGVKPPLPINRSITISGATVGEKPQVDFNFQYGVVEICSNCKVLLQQLAAANERRGTGHAFDFFAGQPGAVLILNDTYRVRLACTKNDDALELISNTPRAPDYPGPPGEADKQIAVPHGVNMTYHGVGYPDSLEVLNMAVDVPRTFQELRGPQGGFTQVIFNATRLCAHTVSDECLQVKSAEACVNEMIDNLLAPKVAITSSRSSDVVVIIVPLIVGAILAAAIAALIVCVRGRRRRKAAAAALAASAARSTKGGAYGGDLEAGMARKGGVGSSFDDADASQHMHAKGWVVTHSSTAPLLGSVQDDRIRFGVLLGAGSFGKVYRGWWAGKEVAIKVIEHDKSNVAAVENEVMLMLSFDHPNVVRAYHFVTYTMGKTPAGSDAQGTAADTSSNSSPGVAAVHTSSSSNSRVNATAGSVAVSPGHRGPSSLAVPAGFGSNVDALQRTCPPPPPQQLGGLDAPMAPDDGISVMPKPAMAQSPRSGSPMPGILPRCPLGHSSGGEPRSPEGSRSPVSPQSVVVSDRSGRSGSSSSNPRRASLSDAIKDIHAGGSGSGRQQQQHAQEWPGTPRRHPIQQQHQGPDGVVPHLHLPAQHRSGPASRSGSGQQQQQQHQRQHLVSPTAVRPGSPRPGSPRPGSPRPGGPRRGSPRPGSPRPGSPRASGSQPNSDGSYVRQGTPLSERIDTSRWPGIIDHVSANSTGHQEGARAKTWLVLEFCDLGTLGNIASNWSPEHEGDEQMLRRLVLLHDAAKGLQALHAKNVVHGDLNARNVLVSSNASAAIGMVAKLADLGLSRVVKQHKTHRTTNTVGTMSHMPPELLRYGRMSAAVDLFAFGVMMWELFTGQVAFRALHYGQFFEMVVLRNQRPPIPQGMPEDYQLLMEHCWSAAPQDRPNVDMLLECLGLMIADRQQNIINKQALHNQPRLAAAPSAAGMENLLQQQQQRRMSSQASSPLPESLHPAAAGGLGPTYMSSTSLSSPTAVHTASTWEPSTESRPQSCVGGRGVTPSGRGSTASGSGSSSTNPAEPPAGLDAAVNSIHESRQRSQRKLPPRRVSSESQGIGLNKTSVTVVADLTTLDHPQQQRHAPPPRQPSRGSMQQQRRTTQPVPECELEGSQYIESW